QYLPVRNLSAHPRRHPHGGRHPRQARVRGAVMNQMIRSARLSRRTFVIGSAAAGGGLILGFHVPGGQAQGASGGGINAWVEIKPDETVVIRIARAEMGQGTLTGLAQLVAEELECDWKKVVTEQITPGQNLARKRVWGEMGTGGSRGIR